MTSVIKGIWVEKIKSRSTMILWIQNCEAFFFYIYTYIFSSFISFFLWEVPASPLNKGKTLRCCWQSCALPLSGRLNGQQQCQQLDLSTAHSLCLQVFRQCEWTSGGVYLCVDCRPENPRGSLLHKTEEEVFVGVIVCVEWVSQP